MARFLLFFLLACPVRGAKVADRDTADTGSDLDSGGPSESGDSVDTGDTAETGDPAETGVDVDSGDSGDTSEPAPVECVGTVAACEEPDDASADVDADGVTDACDYCPATAPGLVVNEGGCACEVGDTYLIAPGAGNNDGSDIGTVLNGADTYVTGTSTGGWDDATHGDVANLACAYGSPTGMSRCFLRFELSALPGDAAILSGTLTLYGYDFAGHGVSYGQGVARDFYATPVTEAWDEISMTGATQPAVEATETSDASYCTFDDRAACALDVATLVEFQRAYGNEGVRVDDGGTHLFTRYHTAGDDSFAELHPSLEIVYSLP